MGGRKTAAFVIKEGSTSRSMTGASWSIIMRNKGKERIGWLGEVALPWTGAGVAISCQEGGTRT